ncbi:MAG: VanZ family protein [Chloroflexi bacterium]|nr:VanZ family protein [Chloroflexota bacterium]
MKTNLVTGGALAWAALIFMLSNQPSYRLAKSQQFFDFIPRADLFAHLFLFFVLAALVHAVLRAYIPRRKNLLLSDTVIFCLIYGMSDELHQLFVPGRTLSGLDLLADVLGATLAVTLWLAIQQLRQRIRRGRDGDAKK